MAARRASVGGAGDGMPFPERLVHLDLKGAPPLPQYLAKLFPRLRDMGATGLLIEWEDTLPYEGRLECVRHPTQCYSAADVAAILDAAAAAHLEVVPLVQTFGHLEFVLKHERFADMRESRDSYMDLCPLANGAKELASELISQVVRFHPRSRRIHVGCDEVFGFASCPDCKRAVSKPRGHETLFLNHVLHVVRECVTVHKVQPFIWHDMVNTFSAEALVPLAQAGVQVVVWSYGTEVEAALPDGLWQRLTAAGVDVWGASAFKGASEPNAVWVPVVKHLSNHNSWLRIAEEVPMAGIFVTGWTRFNHTAALCETLPAGVPSLMLCLATLRAGGWRHSLLDHVYTDLGIAHLPLMPTAQDLSNVPRGNFPGAEMFQHLGMLEGLRRMAEKLGENIRLFCPPYTRRLNPPMWAQLLQQAEHLAAHIDLVATVLLRAAGECMCEDAAQDVVATKALACRTDVQKHAKYLAELVEGGKIAARAANPVANGITHARTASIGGATAPAGDADADGSSDLDLRGDSNGANVADDQDMRGSRRMLQPLAVPVAVPDPDEGDDEMPTASPVSLDGDGGATSAMAAAASAPGAVLVCGASTAEADAPPIFVTSRAATTEVVMVHASGRPATGSTGDVPPSALSPRHSWGRHRASSHGGSSCDGEAGAGGGAATDAGDGRVLVSSPLALPVSPVAGADVTSPSRAAMSAAVPLHPDGDPAIAPVAVPAAMPPAPVAPGVAAALAASATTAAPFSPIRP